MLNIRHHWRLCITNLQVELTFYSLLVMHFSEIQGEQHGADLQHSVVPIHDPGPPPEFIGLRLAHNAFGMLTDLVEYLSVR